MHVIATAGHVDHGKSTLVKALTGADPDRLSEEHRRGLSIELGYCWTRLPEVGDVAFVDVPGHERFISTTLAGVGPVPAVLFVVAADDPWMPQAAEHLAALDALGVSRGVVAVTRSDLADPGAAAERARVELARTSLGEVAVVPVSGRTGAGIDDLRAALVELVQALPPPDADAAVRLWVDRRFHLNGVGTVVTGTLPAGRIVVGDRLSYDGHGVRIRTIQTLGRDVQEVSATSRVALGLAGDVPDGLSRGSALVTPQAWVSTRTVDVRLASPDDLPARPMLHLGAAAVGTRCRPLGGREFVRLTLERPLPLHVGDRVLIRDPGSRQVWGAITLDPDPPPMRRRGSAAERAATLASGSDRPTVSDEIHRRGTVRRSLLAKLGYDVSDTETETETVAVTAGDWLLDRSRLPALQHQLRALVAEHDRIYPLDPGVPVAVAAERLSLPTADLVLALATTPLRVDQGRVRGDTGTTLPSALEQSLQRLADDLSGQPFAAPSADRLVGLGLDARALAAAAKAGRLLRLGDGIVLLPGADEAAVAALTGLPQPFTVSQARIVLGSSRRVVLPLLAHLDRLGRTRRLPDDRRQVADP